jgi:alkaline phosphatase D
VDTLLKQNPHLKYGHSEHRGYVRVELTAQQWRADLRALENEKTPNSNCQTLARFVVESDRPGAQRVS